MDNHSILSDCQRGFCARRNCETLQHDLASTLDNDIQTYMVVLDFKAVDRVPHHHLLRKLYQYDIRGIAHQWIMSFLLGITHRVADGGCFSDSVPVISGVPGPTRLNTRNPCYFCFSSTTSQTNSPPRPVCVHLTAKYTDQSITMTVSSYSKALMLWQSGNPSRAWSFIFRNAVFWVYQDPDPTSDIPTSWKDTSWIPNIYQSTWCWPTDNSILENTHRQTLQSVQQYAWVPKAQHQVL